MPSGAVGSGRDAGGDAGDGGTLAKGGAAGNGGTTAEGGTGDVSTGGTGAKGGRGGAGGFRPCIEFDPGSTGEGGDGGVPGEGGAAGDGAAGGGNDTGGSAGAPVGGSGGSSGATTTCTDVGVAHVCYSGADGTEGVGVCHAGTSRCTSAGETTCLGERTPSAESCNDEDDDCDGAIDELGEFHCGMGVCARSVTACSGGVLATCTPGEPASEDDGCNGEDDDCDGAVDEDCTDECLHVAPDGDDADAASSNGTSPFASIPAALDFAARHPEVATRVCVANGAKCAAKATYVGPCGADLELKNGIDLYGGYESTSWTRCPTTRPHLAPATGRGVVFPASIDRPTVLDGFTIDRADDGAARAITVDGARGAVVSNVTAKGGPSRARSHGVSVMNGGVATLFRVDVDAGVGTEESIGVRAVDASVVVAESTVNGRAAGGTGVNFAVLLDNSPKSRIEDSVISVALDRNEAELAGILVRGEATGILIRGNDVRIAESPTPTRYGADAAVNAISLRDCGGASPWIVANDRINSVALPSYAVHAAISAEGDCRPVIEANQAISDSSYGWGAAPIGIRCAASACVIAGNAAIDTRPPIDASGDSISSFHGCGVRCEAGGCARVVENGIAGVLGRTLSETHDTGGTGLELRSTGTFVAQNHIQGGCAWYGGSSIGIDATSSWSRIENNEVSGMTSSCTEDDVGGVDVPTSHALNIVSDELTEIDVHSNYLQEFGNSVIVTELMATSAVRYDKPESDPLGVFRNNFIVAGYNFTCSAGDAPFAEASANADPRIFENNALENDDGALDQGTTYLDEGTTPICTADDVSALTDTVASGNLGTCGPYPYYPLAPGSPCDDAGTSAGAPLIDIDGNARDDGSPDIGPNEL